MPELPEVEIITRDLKEKIQTLQVKNIFFSGKKFKRPVENLESLINQNILSVNRRNKYIVIETNNFWLVIHLGMTGNLIFSNKEISYTHTHLKLTFYNNSYLLFRDPRRFGSIDIFSKDKYFDFNIIPLFSNLGIEPLSNLFDFNTFDNLLLNRGNIKNFLMDPKKICGIGNIYASEILFLSKINPLKSPSSLTKKEKKDLFNMIPFVLNTAISLGGSSISDFVHTNGNKGEMQKFYKVYGRNNLNCFDCNNKIMKITQNGRSTYYCQFCQK